MRAKRYLLAALMVVTGAVMARTDDVLPFAARLAKLCSRSCSTRSSPQPRQSS